MHFLKRSAKQDLHYLNELKRLVFPWFKKPWAKYIGSGQFFNQFIEPWGEPEFRRPEALVIHFIIENKQITYISYMKF
jgi:hypothetical protein